MRRGDGLPGVLLGDCKAMVLRKSRRETADYRDVLHDLTILEHHKPKDVENFARRPCRLFCVNRVLQGSTGVRGGIRKPHVIINGAMVPMVP